MCFFRLVVAGSVLGLVLTQDCVSQNSRENADFKLAINLYNDRLYDLAEEQLKLFINTFPNTSQGIEARFYLGLTQLKLNQFDDARQTFQTFALNYQDNPKAPDAWWNVGESYAAVHNYKEAALAFERVKVFHPRSKIGANALLQASSYFKLAGEADNARRVLRIVLQEFPASTAVFSARTQLGQMYFEEGSLDQAQNELKRVIEGDPSADSKAQALLILGNIYQSMGKMEQARQEYEEIISKHRTSLALQGAYVNLGRLETRSGNYAEAADNFKKALADKGKADSSLTQEALMGIGDAYVALNDYGNALTQYGRFISSYPNSAAVPDLQWRVVTTGRRAKNYRVSNDACQRILKSNASDLLKRRAQLRLAFNAEEQKIYPQAIQFLTGFLDLHPDELANDEIVFRIATVIETHIHDPRKAASYYDLLAARYPQSRFVDDAYAGAARCHEQLKEFDRALQLYKELIEQFPSSDLRHQAEERVRMIETFEAKQKDAGVEKLALLIGDVVTEKSKSGIAYKLGEIYFHDLKNYGAATVQFTNAVDGGLQDQQLGNALYLRARAYEYLSSKEEKYRAQAIAAYRAFIQSRPADPRRDDAAVALFLLEATSLSAARTSWASLLAMFPVLARRDTMLLRIGELEQEADSISEALATYDAIQNEFRGTGPAEEASFRRVQLLLRLNLVDSVLAAGPAYLQAYPAGEHTAVILRLVGDLALKGNKPLAAVESYKKLIDEFSYTSQANGARRSLADAFFQSGAYDGAITLYAELLEEHTQSVLNDGEPDPEVLLALAKAYQAAGDPAGAKQCVFQLLALEESGKRRDVAGQAYTILGMIYRSEGRLDLATAYFKQAGMATPGTAATGDVAELLFQTGQYQEAVRQFTQLLETATDDSMRQGYQSRIIVAQLRAGDLAPVAKEIEEFTKKYETAKEDQASFELEKGNFYFREEDYAKALKTFERVVEKFDETSSVPVAMYWIGKTFEATEKPQEALKQFDKLLNEYPEAPIIQRVYFASGNINYNAERWDEAIRNYRRVVDDSTADPSLLPFAMSNLIETYEAAGAFDAALSLTRKYLERYPNKEDSFDKRIKIGILYQRLGYNDQSALHLQSLLNEAGSDLEGEIRYYIAEANFYKGDYQQAILDFLKVPYLVTKKGKVDWTANSLYMSGQSYEKMGRYDQAVTMYQQIIDRSGIDETFKAGARKEIDRVKLVLKKSTPPSLKQRRAGN